MGEDRKEGRQVFRDLSFVLFSVVKSCCAVIRLYTFVHKEQSCVRCVKLFKEILERKRNSWKQMEFFEFGRKETM
jgi:hypothetical protein